MESAARAGCGEYGVVMSTRDRLHRLLRLIDLLQSGRILNSSQLASGLKVSRRTVFRDLGTIQEAGIHVHYDEERQGYFLPTRLRVPPGELTIGEAISVLLVCQSLGDKQQGIPFQSEALSAALKISQTLPREIREFAAEITDSMAIHIDARNPLQSAQPQYELLLQSLIERRHVRIKYYSPSEAGTIRTLLSPYRIVFSRRSWYVIGRSSVHRSIRTFNVGRILKAERLESQYKIPPRFSLSRFLGNAWHLIRETVRNQLVRIRFRREVAMNVAEVSWHKTQEITWHDDGSLEFRVHVDGLTEISWWILGYGEFAEVLEPPALRQMIANHARRMVDLYSHSAAK